MDSKLIMFDERNFNIRKRSIDAMSIKLNDLMSAFYDLKIVSKEGVNLNELLHNDMYINELISQRDDVAKLNFKNIAELHKLFLDESCFIHFKEVRNKTLAEFKKAHIPLNYYTLSNGLISVDSEQVRELEETFKKYTKSDQETQAYIELKKLTDSINNLIDSITEYNQRNVITPRGLNMNLIKFKDGQLVPSLDGVQTLSKCLKVIDVISH